MDASIIVALAGIITGVGGLVVSWRTARSTVRKSEVEALDLTLRRLQEENKRLYERQDELERENDQLHRRVDELERQNQELTEENRRLRQRLDEVERRNGELLEELEWGNPHLRGGERDGA